MNDKKASCEAHKNFLSKFHNSKIIPLGLSIYIESSNVNHNKQFLENRHENVQTFFLTLMSDVTQYWPTSEQQYLKNVKSKQDCYQYLLKRIFDGISNDTQVDRLCSYGSVVTEV